MVSREEAYDKLKEDENLLLTAIDNLSEATKEEVIEDLIQSRQEIMEMEAETAGGHARGPNPKKINQMLKQRDKSIQKLKGEQV
jgi:hypothetical protein